MNSLFVAVAIVCGYLIGSIPTAYLVARLRRGIDIRQVGSRNMGAMNVFYTLGVGYGILVLGVDIGKGVGAVSLARWLDTPLEAQLASGGFAVIGHSFPVFLRFRGGKGGATSIGVLGFLMPQAIPIGLGIFAIALLITRFPTLSYGLALGCAPFTAWLRYHSGALVLFSTVLLLMLALRYIPRVREMRTRAGSWRHVFRRKSLKDRF